MSDTQLDRLYYTVDAELGPYKAKMGEVEQVANKTGTTLKGHLDKAGDATQKLTGHTENVRREMLYLGREVSSGNFRLIPSTLTMIGVRMAGIGTAGIAMGAAIIAPFAALAAATYQADVALSRLQRTMAATGYGGGTSGSILDIARSVGTTPGSNLSITGTMSGLGALQPLIPPGAENLTAQALGAYKNMTGDTVDKSADALKTTFSDLGKGALDLHKNFGLLTDEQVNTIAAARSYEDRQKAIETIDQALIQRSQLVTDALPPLTKNLEGASQGLSNFWGSLGQAAANHPVISGLVGGIFGSDFSKAAQLGQPQPMGLAASQRAARAADLAYFQQQRDAANENKRSPAQLELDRYSDAARIARLPMRDRDAARAASEAQQSWLENTTTGNPKAAQAGQIAGAEYASKMADINSKKADTLRLAKDQADGEMRVADAYKISAVEGTKADDALKAHIEWLRGGIGNEKAYADQLDRSAVAALNKAAAIDNIKLAADNAASSAGLSALLSGGGSLQRNKAAAEQNALAQMVGVTDPDVIAKHMALVDQGEDTKTSTANAEKLQTAQNSVDYAREELSLVGQNEFARQKELDLLKAKQEFLLENGDANKADLDVMLAKVGAAADLNAQLQLTQDAQNRRLGVANSGIDLLGSMMDDPKNALKTLSSGVRKSITEYGITNPLKNMASQMLTGKPGENPTFGDVGSVAKAILGGGPKPDGTPGNPIHVIVVGSAGGQGDAGGGLMALISGITQRHIAAAAPQIQAGSVDAVNQAIARGFQFGGSGP